MCTISGRRDIGYYGAMERLKVKTTPSGHKQRHPKRLLRRDVFSDWLRREAKKSGYGRSELAQKIEVDPATMSRFLAGEHFLRENALNRLIVELGIIYTAKEKDGGAQ